MAKEKEFQTDLYQIRQDPAKIMRDIDARRGGNSVFVGDKGKYDLSSRNFFGSTTSKKKGAYGPAMNYSNVPSNFGDGGYTHEGQGMSSGAGAGVGAAAQTESISREEKFLTFVESLRNEHNEKLLESVLTGFMAIIESEQWMQKSQKSGEVKKGKMHSLLDIPADKDIVDVYKSGKSLYNALANKVGDASAMKMINYAANTAGNKLYTDARAYGKSKHDKD